MSGGGVAVVGTGLIGGSVGLAAAAAGFRVRGWDPDPAAVAAALAVGALHQGAETLAGLLSSLRADDVLVLAAPPEATLALLASTELRASAAGLVLDTASVKAGVAAAGAGLARFVPSHPIAGSERSGAAAARADLFAGRVWTLDAAADPSARAAAGDFVRRLGAEPLEIDAREHDALLAFTSHLPQLLAVALGEDLAARLADPRVRALCGTGMQSMTRLGASAWSMWRGIVAENSGPLAQELRNFAAILATFADEVEAADGHGVERRFRRAATGAASLDRDGTGRSAVEARKKATHVTLED